MKISLYQEIILAESRLIKALEANTSKEYFVCDAFDEVMCALSHLRKASNYAHAAETERAKSPSIVSLINASIEGMMR